VARDRNADAIHARQAAFTLIGANFHPMGAMAKGQMPFDKAEFARRAANLEALSKMPWEFFIPGSANGDTKAKSEVWSDAAGFKEKAQAFEKQMAALAEVSRGGDEAAMRAQFGKAAKSCKSCHQDFKNK
jgi:cytochrome c556